MEGDVHGVRIVPPVLIFDNTSPGSVYSLNVVVKNVAGSSRSIRYYGPKSKLFRLKVKNPETPVASGLSVPAIVEYEPKEESEWQDRLVVTVDGEVIEVPIFGYPTRPALELQSEVDFGNVLSNSKVIAREITLVNSGSRAGNFKFTYEGSKPIAIIPATGSVPPDSVQIIKVEFVTRVPGQFEEVASVELEGREPKMLTIRGNVAKPAIEVLSFKDQQPVRCVMFGNTYYGTDRTESAILYNNGPEVVNFVAIVDEDAIAQELGVDLTKTTTAALADETEDRGQRGYTNEIISLVTAIPNQGVLMPYQKTPIFFRFSPRWNASKLGWKSTVAPPPRKDFALFVRLEIIGSNKGFLPEVGMKKRTVGGAFAEIALTGTALPVLLDISPSNTFDFGECPVGEHADVLCTIRNESAILPVTYQFRRIAHFSVRPPNGKIPPGQTQDVIFSFAPKQVGTFKPQQLLDVLGHASAESGNPTATTLKVISTLPVQMLGCSEPITVKRKPRFNPGLTPYISNEVGMFVETTFGDLQEDDLRNAVAGATRTRLHRVRPKSLSDLNRRDVKVAFPNDRAHSVRPTERNQPFQTLFIKMDRHDYVDPDYAFTDDEMKDRRQHLNQYVKHLHSLRDRRHMKLQQIEYNLTNNENDIGIKSAAGLKPKKLTQDEIKPDPSAPIPPNAEWKLLSAKDLAEAEKEALSKPVQEGLNAVPTTNVEKKDCERWLSPQELHQVIVGPPTVEFGKVCLRSVSQRELNIINNLQQYILVEAEIDCRELRQSSPLSQVVPPRSRAVIPIIFESSCKGNFQRSVTYTINKFYKNHVTVTAEVVLVGLELSTHTLVLKPTHGLPAEAGFRGVITLYNRLNYQAEFTWSPDLGEKGTAFSIRPATGVVNANTSLDCEVVWHPSYLAPEDGSFTLLVHGGSPLKLRCQAELGPTNVHFMDGRIMFGAVPVNLTTTKIALLQNSGNNHAYFQVLDPNPFPGLTVTPVHGVVPVGGSAEIRVSLTPEAILKFDTRVQVAIKGGRMLEIRLGGTVEPPEVSIDVHTFNFGGIYCGCKSTLPFKMVNKGNTRCKLEFDLTRYKDFNLSFPGFQTPEDYNYQLMNPGMASVTLAPFETIEGELNFEPHEVAAYDFAVPVVINHLGAPSPAPTPFPPTPAPSNKSIQHIINPRPQPVSVATPRKHVIATALRQPLQISHPRIEFCLPVSFHNMTKSIGGGATKTTMLVNNSLDKLKWGFDLRKVSKAMEDGIIKFLHESGVPFISDGTDYGIEGELDPGETMPITVVFCPNEPGIYECVVPVVINELWDTPYQFLHITGRLEEPRIWFDPPGICLTPVPLVTDVSCEFNVLASQYREPTTLTVETPSVECEDGSTISPLKVTFLQGNEVSQCSGDSGEIDPCCLPCKVTFCSPRPVSFTKPIIFQDSSGRSFTMVVTATADNCLLTCYPFLALHRVDHQIVREQDSIKGRKMLRAKEAAEGTAKPTNTCSEAIIVPVSSPTHATSRPSTSATSSNFQVSSSSYEHSASVTDSTGSTPGPRDGAMNKPPPTSSDFNSRNTHGQPEAASRLGSAMFPDEDSEEGIFHVEVLLAVQRWFSALGWPGGPFPINIPETLRSGISRKGSGDENGGRGAGNAKKDGKTIYDMIGHLSGRSVPGIPINSPLPSDPLERVKQIYWQHSTLLTFLKCQGACIASVRPEYLMTARDFVIWRQLQRQVREELWQQGKEEEAEKIHVDDEMEEEVFEAVSKRAWTDIMLQTLKALVLVKVTPRTYKMMQPVDKDDCLPSVNPDPLASNIYSVGERILLTWLNHYYERYRHRVWKNCKWGGVPPSRWVVNYDFDLLDGLVLAAVMGAYMPFLITSHLQDMYTHPTTAEQCLHNALKVVNAMRYAGIDYDVQAIDITDPNPIMMLLLVSHMYQLLPQYIPKATMDFTGTLHSTVTRQVKITNTSSKALTYQVLLAGRDARDFSVPRGSSLSMFSRQTIPLSVEFTSRFLRPAEATLVLIGSRQGSSIGNTLTFRLRTQVDNITPDKGAGDQVTVKVESPCFELERVMLDVENPFNEGGRFRIVLVESSGDLLDPNKPTALIKPKEKKPRKVRSKTDHGQSQPGTPPSPQPARIVQELFKKKEDEAPKLSAFFSPMESVYLEPNGTTEVEVDFLPFSIGERQCSVIFLNEKVGEFLYSIEARATLPHPSPLPYAPSPNSVRISSAAAAGTGGGVFGGDENVVYWKCEAGQMLKEKLLIPVTNMAKERALILAAQQHMSDLELERRHLTGTLMSCSVTAKTIKMLATDPDSVIKQAKSKVPGKGTSYVVEFDSDHFKLPEVLNMPSPLEGQLRGAPSNITVPKGVTLEDGVVELPVSFFAKSPGHYPCQIILRSMDDIRVYRIECTVNPEGSTAEMVFSAPVHQSITQEIPIVNVTNHDWMLTAKIEGEGFSGPTTLLAKAYQKTLYPLNYKAIMEREVKGKLVLHNADDGQDHVFHLVGKPEKPLSLGHIKLKIEAKKAVTHTFKVPNSTKKKLFYKVQTDLPFITGPEMLSVLSHQSAPYTMTLLPKYRGHFSGVITFVATENPYVEVDSDGDEVPPDVEVKEYNGYRVWFSLEVMVLPAPPERVIPVLCTCQKKALLEVVVRNPTVQDITLTASITGRNLSGPDSISLAAGEKDVYTLVYAPAIIGKGKGSLVFFNELVGEFWYELDLEATSPAPTTLPHMECQLGKWTEQMIMLRNPTDEPLELIPTVSNTNNFSLQRENERPIQLRPHSTLEVPVRFMPSALGQADHMAKIIFHSQQLGEWVFVASGTGLLPQPQDPVSVYTSSGTNTTLIIPFRNPMDMPILASITLKDNNRPAVDRYKTLDSPKSPFSMLLKNKSAARVGPKNTLDIPISFAPMEMLKYEALVTVVVTQEDGTPWPFMPTDRHGLPVSYSGSSGLHEIRWLFPIYGIPESSPIKESQAPVVECRARDTTEQQLEFTLAGVVSSAASQHKGENPKISLRDKTPSAGSRSSAPESVVVGETLATAEEFQFELACPTDDLKKVLPNCTQLKLLKQQRNTATGLVTLTFNFTYSPFKTMNALAYLHVTGALGGLWKFPVRFIATEPPVDDIINVEATGLGKVSSVGFRLYSQSRAQVIFNAYLESGSDPELTVSPQTGQLLPECLGGTLFTINFTPLNYGRLYSGKLIIQTPEMQWSYEVRGVLPVYSPPHGQSSRPMAGPHPHPIKRRKPRNYVTDNLQLITTAVSSPIKGAPILTSKWVD